MSKKTVQNYFCQNSVFIAVAVMVVVCGRHDTGRDSNPGPVFSIPGFGIPGLESLDTGPCEPFAPVPPSCTEYADAVAANGAKIHMFTLWTLSGAGEGGLFCCQYRASCVVLAFCSLLMADSGVWSSTQ